MLPIKGVYVWLHLAAAANNNNNAANNNNKNNYDNDNDNDIMKQYLLDFIVGLRTTSTTFATSWADIFTKKEKQKRMKWSQ